MRSIIKEHKRGHREKRWNRHRKSDPKEASPLGQPLGHAGRAALEGPAGADRPGAEIPGQLGSWRKWLAAPGGSRWAYLTLPPAEENGGLLPPTIRRDSESCASRRRRPVGRRLKASQPIAEVERRAKKAAPPPHSRLFLPRLSRCRIGGAEGGRAGRGFS